MEYLRGEKEVASGKRKESSLGHAGKRWRVVVKDGRIEILYAARADDKQEDVVQAMRKARERKRAAVLP